MIDLRRGVARIGYVLLTVWVGGWIALIVWGIAFGNVDWSEWPLFLAVLIGYPLGVFLLWRLLLWILSGFVRES